MSRSKVRPKQRPITSWDKAPVLMNTNYAALLLGICPDTLRKMAQHGDVPAIRSGQKLWKFEKSALMVWAGVKE